jgi:hypothetical protein
MQVTDVTRSQWTTGPGSPPNSPEAVVKASGVRDVQGGRFHARAVTPARLAPPPTSSLGLAGYSGPGLALWLSSCHGEPAPLRWPRSSPTAAAPDGTGRHPGPLDKPGCSSWRRTHASGLCAAQAAVRQWAAGVLPNVRLLVPVADAPGKLSKPLKEPAAPHFRRRAPRLGTPVGWRLCASVTPGTRPSCPVRLCTAGSRPQPHHLGERACLI